MQVNKHSLKALYRAAKAFLALDRVQDAQGACDLALERDGGADFVALRQAVLDRAATLARRDKERAERARRAKLLADALRVACLARGLFLTQDAEQDDTHAPQFDPEALPPSSAMSLPLLGATRYEAPDPIRTPLLFPVVLMYPQHNTSDLIAAFHEDTTIGQHLAAMFPPEARGSLPWDRAGEYVADRLSVLAVTHKRRILRVGHKLTLRAFLDLAAQDHGHPEHRDGLVLHNGQLRLAVFPKGSAVERTWLDAAKAHAAT